MLLHRPRLALVLLPQDAEEQRARAGHDGDVGHAVVAGVLLEAGDDALEEGVVRDGAHGVVADARGHRAAQPRRVLQHDVEAPRAPVVEVEVDAAVV